MLPSMNVAEANRLALAALRAVLGAAHAFELTINAKVISVAPRPPQQTAWPKGPEGVNPQTDGPWPPSVLLDCAWQGGWITLEVRAAVWRGSKRYNGHLALQVVTLPLNREILWSSVAPRLTGSLPGSRCSIPVSLTLFAREGERDTRSLLASLVEQTRALGLDPMTPAMFRLFDVVLTGGADAPLEPHPREIFERVVKAALAKLPYVVRGEDSDVEGALFFDVAKAHVQAQEQKTILEMVAQHAAAHNVEAPPAAEAPVEVSATSTQDNVFFEDVGLVNFAGFEGFIWRDIEQLNVIVGANDTGKSHILKILYVIARSVQEMTARIDSDKPGWADVLAEKLLWTFQPPNGKIGDLVRHGAERAAVSATLCNEIYEVRFGKGAGRYATDFADVADDVRPQPGVRALFIPPKEVLTSMEAIAAVREQLKRFGFDDTYYDLVLALRGEPIQAELPEEFRRVLSSLEDLLSGRIETENGRFLFKREGDGFGMAQVAEGIKKIGLFTRLIQNGSLRRNSILFIDEPETNLHPRAARALVRMLHDLSRAGVQIYAATHSYFVLKQFEYVARKHDTPVRLCCLQREGGKVTSSFYDLRNGMPKNGIVDEALRLYDEGVDLAMEG